MDAELQALGEAQAAFLSEADAGGFGPPVGAHWDAEHIVAHLIVNERLIEQVTAALMAGEEPDYDNAPGQDGFVLASTIAAADGLTGLIDVARTTFEQERSTLADLPAELRDREVHVCIWHEGERVLDAPRPWWAFAVGASTAFHLPAHTEQLRALR